MKHLLVQNVKEINHESVLCHTYKWVQIVDNDIEWFLFNNHKLLGIFCIYFAYSWRKRFVNTLLVSDFLSNFPRSGKTERNENKKSWSFLNNSLEELLLIASLMFAQMNFLHEVLFNKRQNFDMFNPKIIFILFWLFFAGMTCVLRGCCLPAWPTFSWDLDVLTFSFKICWFISKLIAPSMMFCHPGPDAVKQVQTTIAAFQRLHWNSAFSSLWTSFAFK